MMREGNAKFCFIQDSSIDVSHAFRFVFQNCWMLPNFSKYFPKTEMKWDISDNFMTRNMFWAEGYPHDFKNSFDYTGFNKCL